MWWRNGRTRAGRRALQKRGRSRYADTFGAMRLCSRCGGTQIRRSQYRNQWEWLLRGIRLYPFRCEDCKHRFRRFSLHGR
jgi:hypothetical protein